MTPEQNPTPLIFEAPPSPPMGRTALAFVLAAILLIGVALAYRSAGRSGRAGQSGMSHCLHAEFLAARGERRGGSRLMAEAESEYRLALRDNPRLARARRGLAAILWLRGDTTGAKDTMKPEVDVPVARRDVWAATQMAFKARERPPRRADLRPYKTALEATDLGWSRYVALQALASDRHEAEKWRQARSPATPFIGPREIVLGMLTLFGFLGGVAMLGYSVSRAWPDRIPSLPVPVGVLVCVWAAGLAVQNVSTFPFHWVFGKGLSKVTDNAYFAIVFAEYAAGALLAFGMAHAVLKHFGFSVRDVGWSFRGAPVWAIGGFVALIPVLFLATRISEAGGRLFPHVTTPTNTATFWVASAHGWGLFWVFLTICVAGPFVEELLFRGFLYRGLSKAFGSMGGAVLSSAVFASIHPQLPLGFLPIMCIGIALCVVYRRSGSLTASWILHGINNAVTMVVTLTMYGYFR